ncbi:unnamed protein product [Lathyrus oleraceus]
MQEFKPTDLMCGFVQRNVENWFCRLCRVVLRLQLCSLNMPSSFHMLPVFVYIRLLFVAGCCGFGCSGVNNSVGD